MSTQVKTKADKCTQIFGHTHDVALSDKVLEMEEKLKVDPKNPDLWMQKGIALRGQMLFREAIEAYSIGLTYDPFHALLYRHRGHAMVNIRRYQEGAADFELSLRINPMNWDCWYHLGLAYYLMSDFERARYAYERCIEITDDDESLSAVTDWYWLTLMNLGEFELAQKAALKLSKGKNIVANKDYYQRVLVYGGQADVKEILDYANSLEDDHMYATQGFGIAFYLLTKGEFEKAHEILINITKRDTTWGGFAESATYELLKRWDEECEKWKK